MKTEHTQSAGCYLDYDHPDCIAFADYLRDTGQSRFDDDDDDYEIAMEEARNSDHS